MPLTDADREAIRACQAKPAGSNEIGPLPHVKDPYRQGWTSNAMGCHADQVAEFNKVLEAHGLKNRARFTKDGRFFADSKRVRAEAMRIWGYHDRNSFE